jgi:hypothetical protein
MRTVLPLPGVPMIETRICEGMVVSWFIALGFDKINYLIEDT